MVLGETPAAAMSGSSSRARCHSPAEPHAAMAALNVTVSGGTFSRRICLSILSARRQRPERCSTFSSELYVTVERAILRLRIRSTSASASFQRRGRAHAEMSTL